MTIKGPKYIQIYSPCVPGWGIEPRETLKSSRLAVQTGYYPIVEYVNGELTNKMKITKKEPIEEFLKFQKRFKHLFATEAGKAEIAKWQEMCETNIKEFGLM